MQTTNGRGAITHLSLPWALAPFNLRPLALLVSHDSSGEVGKVTAVQSVHQGGMQGPPWTRTGREAPALLPGALRRANEWFKNCISQVITASLATRAWLR